MVRVYFTYLLSLYIGILNAQQQLPDNDFELWTPYTSGTGAVTYYEPSSGWWGSLNKLSFILSGNPISLTPTSDCYNGISAARLETKQVGTSLIPGLLFSGYFDANAAGSGFIIRGRPFTTMPEKTSGWYKFESVSGDSAGVIIYLTRFNNSLQKRDTIAKMEQGFYTSTPSYTYFEKNFEYTNPPIAPDSIFIFILSSLGWDNFTNAAPGNTFYIDGLFLSYPSGKNENKSGNPVIYFNQNTNSLHIQCSNTFDYKNFNIINSQGALVFSNQISEQAMTVDLQHLSSGVYFYTLFTNTQSLPFNGRFIIP